MVGAATATAPVAINVKSACIIARNIFTLRNHGCEDMRKAPVKFAVYTSWTALLNLFKINSSGGVLHEPEPGVYAIRTNNVEWAKLRGVATRTIQRHRQALTKLGWIKNTVLHGAHDAYEIWVEAPRLGISERLDARHAAYRVEQAKVAYKDLEAAMAEGHPAPSENSHVDKMSATYSFREQSNHLNAPVDKWPTPEMAGYAPPPAGSIHGTQEAGEGAAIEQQSSRNGPGRRSNEAQRLAEYEAGIVSLSTTLWMHARPKLWLGMEISPELERMTLIKIGELFRNVPENLQAMWHGRFAEMVNIAAAYVKRSPTPRAKIPGEDDVASGSGPDKRRFVEPPWRWFDYRTKHGIRGLWKWWQDRQWSKENLRNETRLWRSIAIWENNEKRTPSKQRDRLRLLASLQAELSKLGNPEIVHEFNLWIAKSVKSDG